MHGFNFDRPRKIRSLLYLPACLSFILSVLLYLLLSMLTVYLVELYVRSQLTRSWPERKFPRGCTNKEEAILAMQENRSIPKRDWLKNRMVPVPGIPYIAAWRLFNGFFDWSLVHPIEKDIILLSQDASLFHLEYSCQDTVERQLEIIADKETIRVAVLALLTPGIYYRISRYWVGRNR